MRTCATRTATGCARDPSDREFFLGPAPNIHIEGTGYGFQFEFELRHTLQAAWELGAGLRYWWLRAEEVRARPWARACRLSRSNPSVWESRLVDKAVVMKLLPVFRSWRSSRAGPRRRFPPARRCATVADARADPREGDPRGGEHRRAERPRGAEPAHARSVLPPLFGGPGPVGAPDRGGLGVIVDAKNGYVMTNAHVVKDAREVLVTLKDNRRLPAKLVGTDPGTDIAVVRVDPKNLVDVRFGDSDALQVGDFVIAIGNPFGLGQTATSGIVSALGRSGLSMEGYEHFIQTDASINPGNSGGALVNLRGELVGINTAIIGPAGGNVGIGFAVPVVMARAVMEQLVKFGEVKRGRLGISMTDVVGGEGATVAEVQADSPAAQAGLRKADVVTGLNGRPVRGAAELRAGWESCRSETRSSCRFSAARKTHHQGPDRRHRKRRERRRGGAGALGRGVPGGLEERPARAQPRRPGDGRQARVSGLPPRLAPRRPHHRGERPAGVLGQGADRGAKRRGGVQLNVLRGDNMLTIPVS